MAKNSETKKIRVILVDDHLIVRQGIALLLQLESDLCVVGEADSGPAACVLARTCEPDVIVMDLSMPKGDGLPAIQQLKAEHPEIKIVVLTSMSSVDYFHRVTEAGADAFLIKESGAEHLAVAIRDACEGKITIDASLTAWIQQTTEKTSSMHRQPSAELTPRELQILCLIAQGNNNHAIAEHLSISLKTVKTHVTHILAKLQLDDRTQAAIYAIRQGWV